jgi:hypothetical protein
VIAIHVLLALCSSIEMMLILLKEKSVPILFQTALLILMLIHAVNAGKALIYLLMLAPLQSLSVINILTHQLVVLAYQPTTFL